MSKTIFKYDLPILDQVKLAMPEGAIPLCVQMQRGVACLWALVDPEAMLVERTFRVIGTGHPMPDAANLSYIDTFQILGGDLVFHVFERKGEDDEL